MNGSGVTGLQPRTRPYPRFDTNPLPRPMVCPYISIVPQSHSPLLQSSIYSLHIDVTLSPASHTSLEPLGYCPQPASRTSESLPYLVLLFRSSNAHRSAKKSGTPTIQLPRSTTFPYHLPIPQTHLSSAIPYHTRPPNTGWPVQC